MSNYEKLYVPVSEFSPARPEDAAEEQPFEDPEVSAREEEPPQDVPFDENADFETPAPGPLTESAAAEPHLEEAPIAEEKPIVPVDYRSMCVMVVEQDEGTADLMIRTLKRLGVKTVVWVQTAKTAYFQLKQDKSLFPNVMIMELVLLGISGSQFLAKVRTDPEESVRKLPVIILTESDSSAAFQRALDKQVSAYLRKPIAPGGLEQALNDAVNGKIVEKVPIARKSWMDEVDETPAAKPEPRPSLLARLLAALFGTRSVREKNLDSVKIYS